MIQINCRRIDGNYEAPSIVHQKSPENTLSFIMTTDLEWGCRMMLVSPDKVETTSHSFGVQDITTYVGSVEDMVFIHRAAEAYEFIKMGRKETNPIALDKSVRAWFQCNKLGNGASDFVDRAKELMVGTDIAKAVCLLLIAVVDTEFTDGDLKFCSLKDLIAITQLVLFHKARVVDCI